MICLRPFENLAIGVFDSIKERHQWAARAALQPGTPHTGPPYVNTFNNFFGRKMGVYVAAHEEKQLWA
jgi:hypothetical protein